MNVIRVVLVCLTLLIAGIAEAATIVPLFSTGSPDGKIATLSRTASTGKLETETADDFVLGEPALVTNATFTGLLVGGATTANINDVEIELYHVFPMDSTFPPDGRVVTRNNSPSDDQFDAFDSAKGQLSFTPMILSSSFSAANSVVNGIHPLPNQFTGGEGAVTGIEVQFNVTFTTPFFCRSRGSRFLPSRSRARLGGRLPVAFGAKTDHRARVAASIPGRYGTGSANLDPQ